MPSDNDDKLLSVDDVAKRLGVHRKTVLNWIHSGELVAFDLGKGFKITESDLRDFMNRRRTSPKQPGDDKG
jgi:excisionase family DNA binding protein